MERLAGQVLTPYADVLVLAGSIPDRVDAIVRGLIDPGLGLFARIQSFARRSPGPSLGFRRWLASQVAIHGSQLTPKLRAQQRRGMPEPEVMAALRGFLRHPVWQTVGRAADLLTALPTIAVADRDLPLKRLCDEEPLTRQVVAQALGNMAEPDRVVLDTLVVRLGDDEPVVARYAREKIASLVRREPALVPHLTQVIDRTRDRRTVVAILGKLTADVP